MADNTNPVLSTQPDLSAAYSNERDQANDPENYFRSKYGSLDRYAPDGSLLVRVTPPTTGIPSVGMEGADGGLPAMAPGEAGAQPEGTMPGLSNALAKMSVSQEDENIMRWSAGAFPHLYRLWTETGPEIVSAVGKDVGKGLVEAPRAVIRGAAGGASELLKTIDELGWWLEEQIPLGTIDLGPIGEGDKNALVWAAENMQSVRDFFSKPETVTGQIVQVAGQFLTSAGAVGKITKAVGMKPSTYKKLIDVFVGSAAGFDPKQEERLSKIIDEAAPNFITDYLKGGPDEGALEGRLKVGLENVLGDVAAKGVFLAFKALKTGKGATTEAAAPAAEAPVPAAPIVQRPPVELVSEREFSDQALKFISGITPDNPIQINMDRIDGPEIIKDEIARLSRFLPETEKIPQDVTLAQAKALDLSPEQLILGIEKGAFDSKQIAAGWMMFRSASSKLLELADIAKRTGSVEDMARFNAAFEVTNAIMRIVKKESSEIARALQIHNTLRRKDADMMKQLQAMIDEAGGSATALEMAQRVASLGSPEAVARFVKDAAKAGTGDRVLYAYSNILMSNPATQVVNILDTLQSTLLQVPETFMASMVGDNVPKGEALALFYGQLMGVREGMRYAARTFTTGVEQFAPSGRMEVPGAMGRRDIINPDLGTIGENRRFADYLKMIAPTNLSKSGDQLLKVINYSGAKHALAYRNVIIEQGLDGKDARRYMSELLRDTPEWLHEQSVSQAISGTFNEKLTGAAAKFSALINHADSKTGIPLGRIIIAPFLRTPINLFRWSMHRTPAAFLSPKIMDELAAGGATRDVALARIATGTTIMALFSDMTAQGLITGGGPKDPARRKQLLATGWQPYSFKYGDKYYSYQRFATLGSLIGMSADATELISGIYTNRKDTVDLEGNPVEESVAAAVIAPIAQAVTSKVYMQSIAQFVDAIYDPNRYGEGWVEKFAASYVPAVVGAVERAVDPEIRRAHGWMDAVQGKLPGLSGDLAESLDVWARPRKDENGIWNVFSPVRVSTDIAAPLDAEFRRLNIVMTPPSQTQQFSHRGVSVSIELSPQMHNEFMKLAMQELKAPIFGKKRSAFEALNDLVSDKLGNASKRYKQGGPDAQAEVLKSIIYDFRKAAKIELLKRHPELVETIEDAMSNKIDRNRPVSQSPSANSTPSLSGIKPTAKPPALPARER